MLRSTLRGLVFAILLVLGSMNLAHAGNDNGNGNGGQNNGNQYGHHDPAAPELDPSALGSGLVILVGGIVILRERRRSQR
jgi:hypothetical protein